MSPGVGAASSRRGGEFRVEYADLSLVLDLLAAAMSSGCSIERGLRAVAHSLAHGVLARELNVAGDRLAGGSSWWNAWAQMSHDARQIGRILAPAWSSGAPAALLVRRAASQVRRRRRQSLVTAAARLGVALVLPLGLCLLPAFVLLGLAPVLLSFGGDLLGS